MGRWRGRLLVVVAMMVALAAGAAHLAEAGGSSQPVAPSTQLRILEPTAGQVIGGPAMRVKWTRIADVLWYRVQIVLPEGSSPEFIEYRYVPDTSRDTRRHNPLMLVSTAPLIAGANHRVVVTAYAPGQALIDEFGEKDPLTGETPDYPTDRQLDQYVVLAGPGEVTCYVDP